MKSRTSFDVRGWLFSYMIQQPKTGKDIFTADNSRTRSLKITPRKLFGCACLWALASALLMGASFAQTVSPRITSQIENAQRTTIPGSHPPMARSVNDTGRVPSTTKLQGMALYFSRTAVQESDLQVLLAAQQNPSSPLYHQWLTPDEYAARFGVSDSDVAKVQSWLEQQGFSIDSVARSKNRIAFSGTVGQAEAAFGTELHYYKSGFGTNYAPAADVTIPA